MKKIAFLLGVFLTMGLNQFAWAQSAVEQNGFVIGRPEPSAAQKAQRAQDQAAEQADLMRQVREFIPKDPWRVIGASTNYAKGGKWRHFTGKVIQVDASGVLFEGNYGAPLQIPESEPVLFFVAGFPYKLATDEKVLGKDKFVALESGVMDLGGRSVRKLEYGKSCAVPQVRSVAKEADKVASKPAPRP